MSQQVLIQRVRVVGSVEGDRPVDLRIRHGALAEIGDQLPALPDEEVVEASGRWAVPGLWDAHVHMQQWALTLGRLDLRGTGSPEAVTAAVAGHLADSPGTEPVVGYGYRSGGWPRQPTVDELDVISGDRPVVLISGDVHNGWLSSAALRLLGLDQRTGPLEEAEWFAVFPRVEELAAGDSVQAVRTAAAAAAARGVVGIGDMELERGHVAWAARVAHGVDTLRVRTATYAEGLDEVLSAGLRSGDPVPGTGGLVTMGPLKVIFDGSLNTSTAYCCEPYAGAGRGPGWRGQLNLSPEQLEQLCRRGQAGGLELAVHAIGDAAVTAALDVFAAVGARGAVEHAQLVSVRDVARFARLGVRASVQPAHLLDDRDTTMLLWGDRHERAYPLRSLLDAGVELALGSDAPVSPLDPWLAMAAAVHRSADDREPWNPAEALSPAQALAASADGQTLRPGARGDVVLLDHDPLAAAEDSAAAAAALRAVRVAATFVGGRPTHLDL